jgi:predicted dehydrogenase
VNPVRCAVVGLGRIGTLLENDPLREKPCTHAGAMAESGDCLLVGGCDLQEARNRSFERRWGCPAYRDLDLMISETSPQLAAVATPPHTHLDLVQRLVSLGVGVIICEKPLAPDYRQGERIARLCGNGVKILINHERRYAADYRWVRERVASRRHGELLSVTGRVCMGSAPALDMLLEDGTHLVDSVRFLNPVPLHVQGALLSADGDAGSTGPGGQTLQVLARQKRTPVYLEVGSGRAYALFELMLQFGRGAIRIGNGVLEEWVSGPSRLYSGFQSLRRTGVRRPRITGFFRNMLADAVRCFREGAEPVSSAWDGLEVLRFIDRVVDAVEKASSDQR